MMYIMPEEWRQYFVPGKKRTFSKNTPANIIKEAKEINLRLESISGKIYFSFEEDTAK